MSMLAEPRRKQRVFNLRAKNNAWSNDSEKFGQKMLEKMGWSAGKGLGAKEDGIVEHVLARYKNDSGGLGFEDRNDQWTKNEQDFEGLLKSLSGVNDPNDDKSHTISSLEEKSKRSQTRVHYHKFTRGKDLSKYSEKDLANIFGKKTLKDKPKEVEKVVRKEEQSVVTGQLFTTKGTTADYFKKFKTNATKNVKFNCLEEIDESHNEDSGFKGFSQALSVDTLSSANTFTIQNSKKKKKNTFGNSDDVVNEIDINDQVFTKEFHKSVDYENDAEINKVKKKKKNSKLVELCVQLDDDNAITVDSKANNEGSDMIDEPMLISYTSCDNQIAPTKKKMKKKSKTNSSANSVESPLQHSNSVVNEGNCVPEDKTHVVISNKIRNETYLEVTTDKNKRKKKEIKAASTSDEGTYHNELHRKDSEYSSDIPKKKKSRKKDNQLTEDIQAQDCQSFTDDSNTVDCIRNPLQKTKRRRDMVTSTRFQMNNDQNMADLEIPKTKKSKKHKTKNLEK